MQSATNSTRTVAACLISYHHCVHACHCYTAIAYVVLPAGEVLQAAPGCAALDAPQLPPHLTRACGPRPGDGHIQRQQHTTGEAHVDIT
jgi:hypothetical protein